MTLLIGISVTSSVNAGSPPTCEIVSPNTGDTFCNQQICVTVEAIDPDGQGIQHVTFECNGDTGNDASAPFEHCFQSQNWPDGQYTITVTAVDNEGLISSPESIVIMIVCGDCKNLTVGFCDGLDPNLPVNGEETSPRQELLDFIDNTYPFSGSRDCDEFGQDRHWAHTFDLTGNCFDCCIEKAFLEIRGFNNGSNDKLNLGLTGGGSITMAVELTSAELAGYYGQQISKINFAAGSDSLGPAIATDYQIWIETGGLPSDPTMASIIYTSTSDPSTVWQNIDLTSTYPIPASGSLFVGITFDTTIGEAPCGIDESTTAPLPRAGWLHLPSSGWTDLGTKGVTGVWGLNVGVTLGSNTYSLGYNDGNTEKTYKPLYSWTWHDDLSNYIPYQDYGTIILDLSTLPGIIDFMNDNCFLDVDVQDDTAIDCAKLTFCCCPCCLELVTNDDGDLLWEEYVQPGPPWINTNRERKVCWIIKNSGNGSCECTWNLKYPDNHVTQIGSGVNQGTLSIAPNDQMQFCAPSIKVNAFNIDYLFWSLWPIDWDCPRAHLEIYCQNTDCTNPIAEEITLKCSAFPMICPYELFGP